MVLKQQHTQVDEDTLNALPVAVILFDNKHIHFLNKRAVEIFDIPESKLAHIENFSLYQFLDPKIHNHIKRNNKLILEGAHLFASEREFTNYRGKKIVIEGNSNCVYFKGHKVIQTVFEEISQRKHIASESEKAKNLLHQISASSLDVIFHFTFVPHLSLRFISDSSKTVLGYSPDEIYKNNELLRERAHPDDRHLLVITKHDFLKLTSKEREGKFILRFTHRNGKLKYLEIAVNALYDGKKELIGLMGNMRDVTERTETEKLLIDTKNKFDLITNNGNDIIAFYTYQPEEKYLYVSPNIKKILGFDQKELLKDKHFFMKRLVSDPDEFLKMEKLLKGQKRSVGKHHNYAFKILNADGEEVWLENSLVPIAGEDGQAQFFINILRDITEQKEADLEIENQYINYRNLLDNSPVAYVIHDHGVLLYVNKALMRLMKVKQKNQVLGKFGIDFFQEEDRQKAISRLKDIYENRKEPKAHVYVIKDLEGTVLDVEIKSVLIKFNNKDCVLSLVTNLGEQRQLEREKVKALVMETANKHLQKEIRERQSAEKNLIEKTSHLTSILESSNHLIWTVNSKLQVTSFNQNFFNVVKLHHSISIQPGMKIDEHIPRGREMYVEYWYPKYAQAFKGNKLEFEKDEEIGEKKVFRKIFLNPIVNEFGVIAEISCIAHDITDSKSYEQKLLKQTGKLTAIFDSSHHYIWTIDREEKLTSFNKNYYDLVTALYNTQPYVGLVLDRGVLSNDREYNDLLKMHYEYAFGGHATSFEIETTDKDYKHVYLEIFLNPIIENGQVVEVSGIAHNITDKKLVQQKMELSLKEKEILLREVHHRVKNNMQVISSILNLQSSYVNDEYALALLKESQNRIKTMAYIHESLYQNKSFTSVNFSEYVQTLVNNIVQSYSYSSDKVKLEMNVERIHLSLDSSIPAGLIINELITNCIKHAFPGVRQGTIHFNLTCKNNLVFLELKDDGVGFAEGVDFRNSHSLGLQLVNTLIEQLEADLAFTSGKDKGTQVVVSFKM